jgi:hypothetical protein
MYGEVDFDVVPERFAGAAEDCAEMRNGTRRTRILARTDLVDLMRSHLMAGDPVADAYAALTPEYGFRPLVQMLENACERGVESVPNAPPELVALIGEMEKMPHWIDMRMVEEGARGDRNYAANVLPYVMQMGLIGTFMNKYSALPMALTGTLSRRSAGQRALETSMFMIITALPDAMARFGPGFKACAMVRLMHSMVRYNVLSRKVWDSKVYGVPIPHLDQMPAGLAIVYFMSRDLLKSGRTEFTPMERAQVEHARYRCYLLGLPESLLPTTPQGIVDIMDARAATLRLSYDDEICGPLIRATIAADLAPDESVRSRVRQALSFSFGKLFFLRQHAGGSKSVAAEFGVTFTLWDYPRIAVLSALIAGRMKAHELASLVPGLRGKADRDLVRRMQTMLTRYKHPEFQTDGNLYRPSA